MTLWSALYTEETDRLFWCLTEKAFCYFLTTALLPYGWLWQLRGGEPCWPNVNLCVLFHFQLEGHQKPFIKIRSLSLAERPVGFELLVFWSQCNTFTHWATLSGMYRCLNFPGVAEGDNLQCDRPNGVENSLEQKIKEFQTKHSRLTVFLIELTDFVFYNLSTCFWPTEFLDIFIANILNR